MYLSCVYQIRNIKNGKIYIGSTVNYKYRFNAHRYELKRNNHGNQKLQKSWNEHGEENFEFNVLEYDIPLEEQFKAEQKYLDNLKPFGDNGFNIKTTANGFISGCDHPSSSYTKEEVEYIKALLYEGYSCSYVSRKLNTARSNIYNIQKLITYVSVVSHLNHKLGEVTYKKEIKESQISEIIDYYSKNKRMKLVKISRLTGVNAVTVGKIIKRHKAYLNGTLSNCEICDKEIIKNSNRQKYCSMCKIKKTETEL